jgi:hypothetical protein
MKAIPKLILLFGFFKSRRVDRVGMNTLDFKENASFEIAASAVFFSCTVRRINTWSGRALRS